MWKIADTEITSRFLLGTAGYPSINILQESILNSQTEIITVSLTRTKLDGKHNHFFEMLSNLNSSLHSMSHTNLDVNSPLNSHSDLPSDLPSDSSSNLHTGLPSGLHLDSRSKMGKYNLLPNTAGCYTAKEAINTAHLAREIFNTNWIKLEVIGDDYTLQPNSLELIKATEVLLRDGFIVFPYCIDDVIICRELINQGCKILMPMASPIGSGQGILNTFNLNLLRDTFPDINLIIDAGIGKPSHATEVMELGFDGVLLNSAVSNAVDPVQMAVAFNLAIKSGRIGYEAGIMPVRDFAVASTPYSNRPFNEFSN